ncbi:hypothetical protein EZV62_023448 [Acer yangbiense]|uniref:Uncharacterized protein n=1 Tax=Acer yangbiense TaxID=1000413 RepID=A0A5C7H1R0_9ROSI|nr:hypothetical protein EZV62_023448 [Acer yangbiense]
MCFAGFTPDPRSGADRAFGVGLIRQILLKSSPRVRAPMQVVMVTTTSLTSSSDLVVFILSLKLLQWRWREKDGWVMRRANEAVKARVWMEIWFCFNEREICGEEREFDMGLGLGFWVVDDEGSGISIEEFSCNVEDHDWSSCYQKRWALW